MSSQTSAPQGGIGFVGLLTVVFITLKLLKVISWSWVWVLAPIWLTTAIILLVIGMLTCVAIVAAVRS